MSSEASTARRGLGRGLEVLFGGQGDGPEFAHLPLDSIHPSRSQPRRRFEAGATSALADSIRAQGVLEPMVVRPCPEGGYELIAGERRWRAAREAGVPTVPALVLEAEDTDSLLLALVENVAREELSVLEEARAYTVLLDEFGLSLGDVAERVGRSKPAVSNRIRLLELPEDVLALLDSGQLTEGHGRAVLAVRGHEERRRLAYRIVRGGLSVRGAERAARAAGAERRPRRGQAAPDPALAERVRAAAEQLTGFGASIGRGRVEIPFTDEHELEELAESLERAVRAVRAISTAVGDGAADGRLEAPYPGARA